MSEKIARLISIILHPFLAGAIFFTYLCFLKERLSFLQSLTIFTLDFLAPIIFILILLKKRVVNNLDISDMTKRKYFYFPVFLFLLITLPLFYLFKIYQFFILFQIGFLIWIICWALISLYYKISGHVGGASFIYTTIVFLLGKQFLPIFLLLPIIAWSRIELKEHAWDQTIVGGILGFLISFIVFRVLG